VIYYLFHSSGRQQRGKIHFKTRKPYIYIESMATLMMVMMLS
jgi:hypothetical protein